MTNKLTKKELFQKVADLLGDPSTSIKADHTSIKIYRRCGSNGWYLICEIFEDRVDFDGVIFSIEIKEVRK